MARVWESPCKVNLLLNILGRRADGYHDLETVMLPIPLTDGLEFERAPAGVTLICEHPQLAESRENLVYRAADRFLSETGIREGVQIRLEKRLPLAAGLGGGSANAAITLRALNELFGLPLAPERLQTLAASLGSDVPFFLQDGPAVATGRGERVEPVPAFASLRGRGILLVHPGFGVSTPWAYRALGGYPEALNGRPGRVQELLAVLQGAASGEGLSEVLYNALEVPVLKKYPLLRLYQESFREWGALGTLMSGSGSTTFALTPDLDAAKRMAGQFVSQYGRAAWVATAAL